MTDIVERLRAKWLAGSGIGRLRNPDGEEAAAEIERLRAAQAAAWRAGVDAAAVELRAMAARMRRHDAVRLEVLANAATLEQAADALAELAPPP